MSKKEIFSLEKIKKEIKANEIISFDVFDTLIVRPFCAPSDLPKYFSIINSDKHYLKKRNVLIAKKRIRSFFHGCNGEIKYSDIVKELPDFEKEYETEKKLIKADSFAKELFEFAKSLNKRIIIISDMYYPKQLIAELLEKCGYFGYERIFVSSEYENTKSNGKLYKIVRKELNLDDKTNILHIGNNKFSDVFKAKQEGFNSIFFKPELNRLFDTEKRLKFLPKKSIAFSTMLGMQKHESINLKGGGTGKGLVIPMQAQLFILLLSLFKKK